MLPFLFFFYLFISINRYLYINMYVVICSKLFQKISPKFKKPSCYCRSFIFIPSAESEQPTNNNVSNLSQNWTLKKRSFLNMHSEMEFLNSIFSRDFWAYTRVLSDLSFCLVFFPHFSFYKMLFINRLGFRWIFKRNFKTREENGIL